MELGSLCDGAQLTIITWRLVVNELFLFLFFFCSLDSQLAKVDGGLTHLYSSSHTCKKWESKKENLSFYTLCLPASPINFPAFSFSFW